MFTINQAYGDNKLAIANFISSSPLRACENGGQNGRGEIASELELFEP
ncbi:MAG: hypothetical protein UT41_C0002G0065 [Candidatus Wolfebacteria bacterium GW2011_GWC2_39_22]|uniref:Uncharacterized protein n=1 Tax=Candidatus Wolfebacteria bacterium GW2011_GWC2_39_22 TaxID=1619013 RepID=A0A0G0NHK0_9BACT|nr:MAG: hypothetical protein UT41_C0002G0065 [Candidatus Wolfebacteria bacterium GW2011_GWC2_39_22]